jgi:hypothetical protein
VEGVEACQACLIRLNAEILFLGRKYESLRSVFCAAKIFYVSVVKICLSCINGGDHALTADIHAGDDTVVGKIPTI